MRVLVISQYFPPDGGGGSKRVINAIAGLQKFGHDVEVITAVPHYPRGNIPKKYRAKTLVREIWKNIQILRVRVPALPHIGFLRRLIMYVSFAFSALLAIPFTGSTDIIWAANSNVFSSLPAVIFGFFKKAPVIRNVDDLWPETAIEEGYLNEGWKARVGRFLAKMAYKKCNAITPISNGYKRELIERYRISSDKIHVVEVGVDMNRFYPLASEYRKFSKTQPLTVMYSGILGTGYNFEYLIKVAELLKNDDTIQFVIRGFGEREKEIQRKRRKHNLPNVQISTSFIGFDKLIQVLNSADIFFLPMMPLPAHEAGLPTKLLEYMACGKPIVCSSEGDAAELVRKAGCGIAVPHGDPHDAVKAILTLKSDESLRHMMGKKGRQYVEKHLSIEEVSRKLERLFLAVTYTRKLS